MTMMADSFDGESITVTVVEVVQSEGQISPVKPTAILSATVDVPDEPLLGNNGDGGAMEANLNNGLDNRGSAVESMADAKQTEPSETAAEQPASSFPAAAAEAERRNDSGDTPAVAAAANTYPVDAVVAVPVVEFVELMDTSNSQQPSTDGATVDVPANESASSTLDEVVLDVPQQAEEQLDYGYDDLEEDVDNNSKKAVDFGDSADAADAATVADADAVMADNDLVSDDDDDLDSFVVFDEAVSATKPNAVTDDGRHQSLERSTFDRTMAQSDGSEPAARHAIRNRSPSPAANAVSDESAVPDVTGLSESSKANASVTSVVETDAATSGTPDADGVTEGSRRNELPAEGLTVNNTTHSATLIVPDGNLDSAPTDFTEGGESGVAASETDPVAVEAVVEREPEAVTAHILVVEHNEPTPAQNEPVQEITYPSLSSQERPTVVEPANEKREITDATTEKASDAQLQPEPAAAEVLATNTAAQDGGKSEVKHEDDAVDDTARPERLSPPRTASGGRRSISPKKARIEWTIGKDGKLQENSLPSTDAVPVDGDASATAKEAPVKEYLVRFRNVAENVQALEFKDFVSQHVQVVTCRLLKGKKGQINALVSVPDHDAVEQAVKTLNGVDYKGQALGVAEHLVRTDAETANKTKSANDAVRRSGSRERNHTRRTTSSHRTSTSPRKRSPPRTFSDASNKSRSRRLSIKRAPPTSSSSARNNNDRRRSRSRSPPSNRQRNAQIGGRGGRSSKERESDPRASGSSSSRRRAISPPHRTDSNRSDKDNRKQSSATSNNSRRGGRGGRMSRSRSPPSSGRYANDGRFDRDRLGPRRDSGGLDNRRRNGASPPPRTALRTADLASRQQQTQHSVHRVGPPGFGGSNSARPEFGVDGRRTLSRMASPSSTHVQSRIGPPSVVDAVRTPGRGPPLPAAVQQNIQARQHSGRRSPSPHSLRRTESGSSRDRVASQTEDLRPHLRARRERNEMNSEEERQRHERLRIARDAEEELERIQAERRKVQKELEEKETMLNKIELVAREREGLEREKRRQREAEARIAQLRNELTQPAAVSSSTGFAVPGGAGGTAMQQPPHYSPQQMLMQLDQQRKAAEAYGRMHAAPQQQHADYSNGRTMMPSHHNVNEVRVVERDLGGNMQRQQQQDAYGMRTAVPSRGGDGDGRRRDDAGASGKYADSMARGGGSGAAVAPKRAYDSVPAQRGYNYSSGGQQQQAKSRRENSPQPVNLQPAASTQATLDALRALQQQRTGYPPVSQQQMATKQPMNLGSSVTRGNGFAAPQQMTRQTDEAELRQYRQSSSSQAATGATAARGAVPQYNMMPQQQQPLSNSGYGNAAGYTNSAQPQTSQRGNAANDPSIYSSTSRMPSGNNNNSSSNAYQQALAMHQQQQQQQQYNQTRMGTATVTTASGSAGRSAVYGNAAAGVVDARQHLQQQQYRDAGQMVAGGRPAAGGRGAAQYSSSNAATAGAYANAGYGQPQQQQQQQQNAERYWRP